MFDVIFVTYQSMMTVSTGTEVGYTTQVRYHNRLALRTICGASFPNMMMMCQHSPRHQYGNPQ